MDFFDPKAKRRRTIQLYVGYGLMAALIGIITLILVFQAYGFDVDRKTGEVIQNGLIFVDSAPDKAAVILNNQEQKNKTNNRFALPSGNYDLKISKDGYRDWNRHFQLDGGEVERFNYPLLLPTSLKRSEIQATDVAPAFVTQSPDRRWTIASQAASLTNFTEYDLNTLTNDKPATKQFTIPANIFTVSTAAQSIEPLEWSNDNKHILVKHSFGDRSEFAIISRDQPATSININVLLNQNPTSISLIDKKFDHWYLYTQQGGVLQAADTKKTVTPILNGITSYKSHGDDTILYSSLTADGKNQQISLKQGNDTYAIKDVLNGGVKLDLARYDNAWYVVVNSDAEQKTYIYKDPINTLQKRDGSKVAPFTILKSPGVASWVAFSQNTRFVVAQTGQHFEVFDAEVNENFHYDIPDTFDAGTSVKWMDGHRMTARSAGKVIMFDFDGSNKQQISASIAQSPALFDRDYTVFYSLDNSVISPGKTAFYATQLRLEADR